jgi:hypothetical protein
MSGATPRASTSADVTACLNSLLPVAARANPLDRKARILAAMLVAEQHV